MVTLTYAHKHAMCVIAKVMSTSALCLLSGQRR